MRQRRHGVQRVGDIALERYQQPYLFLTKQVMWVVLGLAVLAIAMRVDYRAYRNDAFVWALLGLVGLTLVAVLFSSPVNGTQALVWPRRVGRAAVGVRQDRLACCSRR